MFFVESFRGVDATLRWGCSLWTVVCWLALHYTEDMFLLFSLSTLIKICRTKYLGLPSGRWVSCWTGDWTGRTIGVSALVSCSVSRPEVDGCGLRFSWPAASRRRRFWSSFTSETSDRKMNNDKSHKYNCKDCCENDKVMNLYILVNRGTNKPDGGRTLSSESDRGVLCLFNLPPFPSPASILSCKQWHDRLHQMLLNRNLLLKQRQATSVYLLLLPLSNSCFLGFKLPRESSKPDTKEIS